MSNGFVEVHGLCLLHVQVFALLRACHPFGKRAITSATRASSLSVSASIFSARSHTWSVFCAAASRGMVSAKSFIPAMGVLSSWLASAMYWVFTLTALLTSLTER